MCEWWCTVPLSFAMINVLGILIVPSSPFYLPVDIPGELPLHVFYGLDVRYLWRIPERTVLQFTSHKWFKEGHHGDDGSVPEGILHPRCTPVCISGHHVDMVGRGLVTSFYQSKPVVLTFCTVQLGWATFDVLWGNFRSSNSFGVYFIFCIVKFNFLITKRNSSLH